MMSATATPVRAHALEMEELEPSVATVTKAAPGTDRDAGAEGGSGAGASKKKKKIPDIGLASFVTFKVQGADIEVFPPPAATLQGPNGPILEIGNIPLPVGVPAPTHALTLLYGYRDALDEMQAQYRIADEKGHQLLKVEFKLQVGTDHPQTQIVMGTASEEDLGLSRFLNVLRLHKDLTAELLAVVNERLQDEANQKKKAAYAFERILDAGTRPDILCDAIRSMPKYRHVNSVVYSVPDGTPRGRKVCTIFETKSVIDFSVRGDAPFEIRLPSKL